MTGVRTQIRALIEGIGQRHIERSVSRAVGKPSPSVLTEKYQVNTGRIYTPPDRTARNGLTTYESNPFVHVVIDRVASKFAGQDWYLQLRQKDSGEKIYEHPVLDFMRSGSEIMDGYQSRRIVAQHLDLAGETYLLLGRDSSGRPASYLPIPPNWVIQPAYRQGETFDIMIPRTSVAAKIPWSEMIWIKRPRPSDPLGRGYSATQALLTEIALHEEIASFFYNFVKNRARPDIIITGSAEDPLDEDSARAMEARWIQNHGGSSNAGKPLFSNAPLNVQELGLTMQETQLVEMRKIGRDFIFEVYGVQPSVFGIIENANRATAEAADFTMARDVIEPRLNAHAEALYPRLLIEFPDLIRYKLKYDNPVSEDKEFVLNVVRAAPSAFWKNDARRLAGLEPDPELEGELIQEDAVDLGGTANGDPNALADGNTDSPNKGLLITRALNADEIDQVTAGLGDNRESLVLLLMSALRSSAIQAALDIGPSRGVDLSVIMDDLKEWSDKRARELVDLLNDASETALKAALAAAGDDRAMIGGAVLTLFAGWALERTFRVATTEANGAMSTAELAIGKAAGATSKVWLTQADERVRSIHRPMHGQVKAIGEAFVSGNGETGQAPGLFPSAANNAACRCGSHSYKGDRPTDEALASLAAAHDRSLSMMEVVTAGGIRSFFAEQQRAVLSRLGGIRL